MEDNFAECKRLLEEAQGRLREVEEREQDGEQRRSEVESLRAEVTRLKKDKTSFEKMIEEHKQEEKKLPWNVDTISKEGFNKVSERGVKTVFHYLAFPDATFFFLLDCV